MLPREEPIREHQFGARGTAHDQGLSFQQLIEGIAVCRDYMEAQHLESLHKARDFVEHSAPATSQSRAVTGRIDHGPDERMPLAFQRRTRKNRFNNFVTMGVSLPRRQVSAAFFMTSTCVG